MGLFEKYKEEPAPTGLFAKYQEEEEPSWLSRVLEGVRGIAEKIPSVPEVRLKEKVPLIEHVKGLLPRREAEPIPQLPAGFQPAEAVTTRVERPPVSPESVLRVPTEEERRTGLFARPAIRAAEPEKAIEPPGSAVRKRIEKVLEPGESAEVNAVKDVVRFAVGIPEFFSSIGTGLLDAVATADTFEELMDSIVSPIGKAGGEMAEGIRRWFELVAYQVSPLEGKGGYEEYERKLEEFNKSPLSPAISLYVLKGVGKQIGRIPKTKRITEVTDYMKARVSRLKETPKVVSEPPPSMEFVKELKREGVTEKPRKGYRFERTGPGIMGGVSSVGQEASVQRIMNALKEAKPLRKEQEILYSKERAAKIARLMAVRKKTTGEAGYYAEKGQLRGELPKLEFESIRSKISQADIDNLFNKVRDSDFLTEFEKITAREGLVKMFGEHGGRVPTKGELTLLEQVFPLEFIETVMAKRPLWTKIKEAGWQLANIPRSVMASFDLSFGGRQGAFAAPRYRKEFFNAWRKQFRIFGSEKAYQASREALTKHPDFMFAKESKISFTELGKIMTQREEVFMSAWAEKIPVVGRGIRASSRAYTSFANQFRMDIFSRMVKDAEAQGLNPRKNPYLARQIADFVNNATGRGSLGSFETAAVALNAVFFSPRLNMARMRLLNPAYYIKQPKFVRTQALKTALTASGTAVTILTLADLIPGVEAGTNPLSADFGKLKIRNTRIDLLAGFGQFMRAGAQIAMGKTISTVTGKETILGEGYKPRTRWDILLQQIEYKESPIASFATTLLKGKDFAGKDVSIPKEVGRRFVPMVIADMIELAKEDPQLLPLSIPAIFGMGLQTYAHPYAKLAKAEKEHGFMSGEWKKVRDRIEESGFKYKHKKYLEYKKGMLPSKPSPGLFEKYKEEPTSTGVLPLGAAPPGGGTVGMSLLLVFEKMTDLIKQKPEQDFIGLQPEFKSKKLPDTPTGRIPYFTDQLIYTRNHPEVTDSLVAFAKQINFDEIVQGAQELPEADRIKAIVGTINQLGMTFPSEEEYGKTYIGERFKWPKYGRLYGKPITERKMLCTAASDLFYVFGNAAGLNVGRVRLPTGKHALNVVKSETKMGNETLFYTVDITPTREGPRLRFSGPHPKSDFTGFMSTDPIGWFDKLLLETPTNIWDYILMGPELQRGKRFTETETE